MNLTTARVLVEAGYDIGVDVALYEGYSGRGMFGKVTDAVTVSNLADFAAVAAKAGINLERSREDETEFLEDLQKLRQDSLGRSIIIY